MKTNIAMTLILVLAVASTVSLPGKTHAPQAGDVLNINRMTHFPAIGSVCDSIVDFSKARVGKAIERRYVRVNDSTMYEVEQGNSRLLRLHDDTLHILSEGRPGSLMKARIARPMPYLRDNRCLQGTFDYVGGDGSGDNLRHSGLWTIQTPRESEIITPDGDSISSAVVLHSSFVSRIVRTQDNGDSVLVSRFDSDAHDYLADSICLVARIASYYIEGYHYPLLQTEEYAMYNCGVLADSLSTGYYYPLSQQEIDTDIDPMAIPTAAPAIRHAANTGLASEIASEIGRTECSVYPTVFRDNVNISVDAACKSDFKVYFYNMSGMVLLTTDASRTLVDTSGLSAGTYLVEVTDGNECYTFKLVKL